MLREFAATVRLDPAARARRPAAAAFAVLAAVALLAGCGIKGPLKLPPAPASSKPATANPTPSPAPAPEAPAPSPDGAKSEKP
jgi:predicted small lipoprotein YifL